MQLVECFFGQQSINVNFKSKTLIPREDRI
jgi:hypothetical protein